MNSLASFFTDRNNYSALPIEVRKRVPYLIYTNVVLLFFFYLSSTIKLVEAPKESLAFAVGVWATSLVFVGSLLAMRKGKYEAASYLTLAGLFLNLQWMGFLLPVENYYQNYRYLMYEIATIFVAVLVSFTPKTIVGYGVLCIAGEICFSLTAIADAEGGIDGNVLAVLGFGIIILITVTLIGSRILVFTTSLIAIAAAEEQKSKLRFERLKKLLEDSQGAFRIGETIVESSAANILRTQAVESAAERVKGLMDGLADSSSVAARSSMEILGCTARMKSGVEDSHRAIEATTGGVAEIAATIAAIAESAGSKRTGIKSLLAELDRRRSEMEQARKSVHAMVESAREFASIIGSITDISERTSLLAMNASIEAAHAGASGKGFAVIAGEIKKLSESARKSTEEAAEILAANSDTMANGAGLIENAVGYFASLSEQVRTTADSIDGILKGLDEIAKGTAGIKDAANRLFDVSGKNSILVGDVEKNSLKTEQQADQVAAASKEILKAVSEMRSNIGGVSDTLKKLDAAGKANIEALNSLEMGLQGINRESAAQPANELARKP